jgi:ubiquinone/menaquinone biosynthesis C-methylase UbiE
LGLKAEEKSATEAGAAFGVDIVPLTEPVHGFTYKQYDGVKLPFPDKYFSLCTIFMATHHFTDPNATLADLHRAMRPNATVVVREHDVRNAGTQIFLDFVHAVYMTVVGHETTAESFAASYQKGQFASYRPMFAWKDVFEKAGFALQDRKLTHDMFDSCYMILKRS